MKFDLSQSIAAHDSFPARIASAPGPAREIQLKPNAILLLHTLHTLSNAAVSPAINQINFPRPPFGRVLRTVSGLVTSNTDDTVASRTRIVLAGIKRSLRGLCPRAQYFQIVVINHVLSLAGFAGLITL